ncbi:WhiB family transcriptional regulator [Amycolatopsis sp. Hca4]|uniref:WhiB family transcriptional regulator n=1 Tax=Amycolatopsis sp. Hca4 TaxID=2742131 RepID=UPI001591EF8B|nr:WhiB family transcriptional regulator [Amycolatopsis sp. Hca4]QKV74515.1 WhiB family transcriptional regulator [Amycolatopsis sp. Hca4]
MQLLAWLAETDRLGSVAAPDGGRCSETDADIFHPGDGGNTAPALRICRGCELRAQCLAYALGAREKYGIWGGTTVTERAWLRSVRRNSDQRGAA